MAPDLRAFSERGASRLTRIAEFQQRLRDDAFGPSRSLLTKYACRRSSGNFQTWVTTSPEHDGIKPNENFARELMQLFTIGGPR
jgi:uncharacterized protein (DUF1800 family)